MDSGLGPKGHAQPAYMFFGVSTVFFFFKHWNIKTLLCCHSQMSRTQQLYAEVAACSWGAWAGGGRGASAPPV